MSRKAISKSLRFAILERDSYTCQYCGRKAPEVKLTVDHVVPVAANGNNDPTNLLTCCVDCNTGKGSKLSLRPVDNSILSEQLDSLRQRRDLLIATAQAEKEARSARRRRLQPLLRTWENHCRREPTASIAGLIDGFLSKLPAGAVESAISDAGRWGLKLTGPDWEVEAKIAACFIKICQRRIKGNEE